MANLKTIRELVTETERQNLTLLEGRVANLKTTFAALVADQDELGLTEFEGTQGRLRDGGNMMERIVNEDMSWLSDADQKKILVPLMLMRRHEVEYRLTREESGAFAVQGQQRRLREGLCRHRRRRGHEAAAHRSGEELCGRVRRLDGKLGQDRAVDRGDFGRDAADAARGRRDRRLRQQEDGRQPQQALRRRSSAPSCGSSGSASRSSCSASCSTGSSAAASRARCGGFPAR